VSFFCKAWNITANISMRAVHWRLTQITLFPRVGETRGCLLLEATRVVAMAQTLSLPNASQAT